MKEYFIRFVEPATGFSGNIEYEYAKELNICFVNREQGFS
jgi:hypothetical protein